MTTMALPSGGGSAGEAITHAGWRAYVAEGVAQLRGLAEALEAMAAGIASDDGDQAQIAEINGWQALALDWADQGDRLITDVDAVQVPVGEAVAAAGGSENAPHKEYFDDPR